MNIVGIILVIVGIIVAIPIIFVVVVCWAAACHDQFFEEYYNVSGMKKLEEELFK